jgi:hypothetical protein
VKTSWISTLACKTFDLENEKETQTRMVSELHEGEKKDCSGVGSETNKNAKTALQ